ncbi:U4/U6 small nuclear ribonucleoprotein PRP4-like protein [Tanacetum coccineum]
MTFGPELRGLPEESRLFREKQEKRLRMIMASLDSQGQLETLMRVLQEEEEGCGVDEGEEIQYESVMKAAVSLVRAKRKRDDPDEDLDAEINWALENAKRFKMDCSKIGDDRPLSGCSFSADGNFLATWEALKLSFVLVKCCLPYSIISLESIVTYEALSCA